MPIRRRARCAPASGAIGFSGKAGDTIVRACRAGEKARLLAGACNVLRPNMIILDEPTTISTSDSRAALAEAINEFPGAVIMVSHDRYLIEPAPTIMVVPTTPITNYDGDLDDYRRMVLSARGMRTNSRDRASNEVATAATSRRARNPKTRAAEQKISDAEAEIARINGIIAKIDTALALPDLFNAIRSRQPKLSKARAGAASALLRAEEDGWGKFAI